MRKPLSLYIQICNAKKILINHTAIAICYLLATHASAQAASTDLLTQKPDLPTLQAVQLATKAMVSSAETTESKVTKAARQDLTHDIRLCLTIDARGNANEQANADAALDAIVASTAVPAEPLEVNEVKQQLRDSARSLGFVLSQFTEKEKTLAVAAEVKDCKLPFAIEFEPGFIKEMHINAAPGTGAEIQCNGNKQTRPSPVNAQICQLQAPIMNGSKLFNLNRFEAFLLKAQDIPGVSLQSQIKKLAPEPGTSLPAGYRVDLAVRHLPVSGFVAMDNSGPAYAGPLQITAGLGWNTPATWLQRLDATAFSTANREQYFVQAGTLFLLGSDGMRLRAYGGFGTALPGGDLGVAGFRSRVLNGGMELQMPVVRSRRENLTVTTGLEFLDNDIGVRMAGPARQNVTESHLRMVTLTTAYEKLHLNGLTQVRAALGKGLNALGATPDDSRLTARSDSRAAYTKLSGELLRRQGLASGDLFWLDLTLSVRGQYAFDVLPPSQKLLLGGERGGRGYVLGQLSGDHGVVGSTELSLRYSTRILKQSAYITFFAFQDYATAWEIAPFDPGSRDLWAAGLGARTEIDGRWQLTVTGTRRLTRNPTRTNVPDLARYRGVAGLLYRF